MKCTCGKGGKCSCGGMASKKQKMAYGGMAKKKPDMMGMGMYGGGMTKKKGYYKGGYCGASNPAERPINKSS